MMFHPTIPAVAVLVMSAPTFAQGTSTTTPASQARAEVFLLAPAGELLGLSVKNTMNENVGEIGDLLIDPDTGAIRHAVIEAGGFLGLGESQRVVPWSHVQVSADPSDPKKVVARTNLTKDQVQAAPECKSDTRFDGEFEKRVDGAFGRDPHWPAEVAVKSKYLRLSELDGVRLDDAAGKEVGVVQDLVLAPRHGCIAFAVVDTVKEAGDKDVALPFSQIDYAVAKDEELVAKTPIGLSRIAAAPECDGKDLKSMSDSRWLSDLSAHYSVDPFWKDSRFAAPRELPKKGP